MSDMTMEALPPDSRARKLVHAPSPFNARPATEQSTTILARPQWGWATTTTPADKATIAQQNQRNDRSLVMQFVDSFCVTPVMPHNTSARIANPSQTCMVQLLQALSK